VFPPVICVAAARMAPIWRCCSMSETMIRVSPLLLRGAHRSGPVLPRRDRRLGKGLVDFTFVACLSDDGCTLPEQVISRKVSSPTSSLAMRAISAR
jgi:hypothetical protein